MKKAMGTIAALAAAAAVLVPAQAAIAGDPDERPRKLAYDQATLPPGNWLQDTFTPGGAIVQMYYRCEPGVTGNIVLSAGGGSPPGGVQDPEMRRPGALGAEHPGPGRTRVHGAAEGRQPGLRGLQRLGTGLSGACGRAAHQGGPSRRRLGATYRVLTTPITCPSGSLNWPSTIESMIVSGPMIRVPPRLSAFASASSTSGTST